MYILYNKPEVVLLSSHEHNSITDSTNMNNKIIVNFIF